MADGRPTSDLFRLLWCFLLCCACDDASLLSCAPCCLLVAVVMGKPLLFARGRRGLASLLVPFL